MPIDIEKFKAAYTKWVEEGLADFQAGKVLEVVKRYPLIVSDDVPWTPYRGNPSEQTVALVTESGTLSSFNLDSVVFPWMFGRHATQIAI